MPALAATAENLIHHPGIAKVWLLMDGTGTISIQQSHGVSSIVDGGTGTYTINFSIPFSLSTYAWAGSTPYAGDGATFVGESSKTVSAITIKTVLNGALADVSRISFIAFGDQ